MSLSLDALRARKKPSRAERAETLCLAPDLVGEVMELSNELETISNESDMIAQRESTPGPPARLAGSESVAAEPDPRLAEIEARVEEIKARLRVLNDEMAEYEGVLRLRAVEDGAWRLWANAHPARGEGEPGHKRDVEVAGGYCNADDLILSLATYAHSWNGEVLDEGVYDELIAPNLTGGDKKSLARLVVTMHESDMSLPKWRSALSVNLRNERASTSPDVSASAPDVSSAGSPQSDTSSTTQPAT